MEQNVDTVTPMTPVIGNKRKSGNGLKIVTAIACIVAVCGIGFGVYGMMQSGQKDDQIADLKVQIEENNEVVSTINNQNDKNVSAIPADTANIVEAAINKEVLIQWPDNIERLDSEPETLTNKVVLPKITIDSEVARSINDKIINKYSTYLEDKQSYNKGPYDVEITYDSVIRDNILYLIIKKIVNSYRATGGAEFDVYYFDIKNDVELSVQEIAEMHDIPQNATVIIPSVAGSFDYYYHNDKYCYRLGCEVIDNTF